MDIRFSARNSTQEPVPKSGEPTRNVSSLGRLPNPKEISGDEVEISDDKSNLLSKKPKPKTDTISGADRLARMLSRRAITAKKRIHHFFKTMKK